MFVRDQLFTQCLAQAVVIDNARSWRGIALNATPYWFGKVAVVAPARDDVPMQMRRHVAEACQIDLVRSKKLANDLFDGEDHAHQGMPGGRFEVAHLADMSLPDDAAKARVMRIVNANDATGR
jgi:hypothetical protein